jgi:DNA-binding NtrC family response regulator
MRRIVVVEDNMDIRTILRKRLEKSGYQVVQAEGGFDLLGLLRNIDPPDGVVLDLVLPQRSGVELLCSLKSKWPQTKVFVFSAHEEYKDRESLQKYICGFYLKSEGMDRLLQGVARELCAKG